VRQARFFLAGKLTTCTVSSFFRACQSLWLHAELYLESDHTRLVAVRRSGDCPSLTSFPVRRFRNAFGILRSAPPCAEFARLFTETPLLPPGTRPSGPLTLLSEFPAKPFEVRHSQGSEAVSCRASRTFFSFFPVTAPSSSLLLVERGFPGSPFFFS